MSRVIVIDTETTGLDPEIEDIFEIGAIDVHTSQSWEWRIRPTSKAVNNMHPKAIEVNRYFERTQNPSWRWDNHSDVLDELDKVLNGAHMVGAVPDFDARHITKLYKRFGSRPPRWHYHLIDVETMAVGYLHGIRHPAISALELPWNSDDLSRMLGVEPPSEGERHTALADAKWAAKMFRKITEGAP